METKFSTEWTISDNFNEPHCIYVPAIFVRAEYVNVECRVFPPGYGIPEDKIEESKVRAMANAKLIATAKDMFIALLDIVDQYEKYEKSVMSKRFPFPVDLADSIRVFGKAAIKKVIE